MVLDFFTKNPSWAHIESLILIHHAITEVLQDLILHPMHPPGLGRRAIVETQVVEQAMGDIQGQLRLGPWPLALASRRAFSPLTRISRTLLSEGSVGVGQIETQAIRGPLPSREPSVQSPHGPIPYDRDGHNGLGDRPNLLHTARTRVFRACDRDLQVLNSGLTSMAIMGPGRRESPVGV